jgi:hypothetical protein
MTACEFAVFDCAIARHGRTCREGANKARGSVYGRTSDVSAAPDNSASKSYEPDLKLEAGGLSIYSLQVAKSTGGWLP